MPAELRLRIEAGPEVMAALAARKEAVAVAVKRALSDSVNLVHRKITLNLTGAVLRVQTGRLRQSMQTFIAVDGLSATVGTNVEYARIHEFGGTTRPHEIRPRGIALAWPMAFIGFGAAKMTKSGRLAKRQPKGARIQFAKVVHHPGAVVPARPYMRPALEDSRGDIERFFVSRILAALRRRD